MALGLLAAPAMTMAQNETPTVKPSNPVGLYTYKSHTGSFIDLTTFNPETSTDITLSCRFALGEDLETGATLDNVFFVGDADQLSAALSSLSAKSTSNADEAGAQVKALFKTINIDGTATEDATERQQTALPINLLGVDKLSFAGHDMQGIAFAAFGGILFSDAIDQTNSLPTLSCQKRANRIYLSDYTKNFIRFAPYEIEITKGDKAPVTFALGSDDAGWFIWVQFDYQIKGKRWISQIRHHENGQTDYIVGSELALDGSDIIYFSPCLVQTKDEPNNLGLLTLGKQKYNWDLLTSADGWTDSDGLPINADYLPAIGHTITITPSINAEAFDMPDPTISYTKLDGVLRFDPSKAIAASFDYTDTICVAFSRYKTLGSNHLPAFPETGAQTENYYLAYVGHPDKSGVQDWPINVKNLTMNTEYYIHVFSAHHTAATDEALTYSASPLTSFGPYKTLDIDIPAVKDIHVTIAEGNAQLTFQPAEGFSMMLVKSDKLTAPAVAGKLVAGDNLGTNGADGTVIAILDAATTAYNLPMEAGEGRYLHFYSVMNAGTDDAVYSEAVTAMAYRPAETLPFTWSFNANQAPVTPTALPLLPPGWQHDASSTFEGAKYFSVANSYVDAVGYGLKALPNPIGEVSVITPSFVCNTPKVEVIFTSFYSYYTPVEGDWIRIEYRENGGEWQEAKTFTHTDLEAPNNASPFPLSIVLNDTKDKVIDLRYTLKLMTTLSSHYIKSVEVTDVNPCLKPSGLRMVNSESSNHAITMTWDAIAEAHSFTVAYQEADTDTPDEWTEKPATEKTLTLDGLNSMTTYRIKVSAACTIESENLTSAFSDPVVATTYRDIPYTESLGDVYDNPNDPSDYTSPTERGVKTYTGKIGGNLTEANNYETWNTMYSLSGRTSEWAQALGTYEEASSAVFVSPRIYTAEPAILKFTLNSFSLTQNADYTFSLKEKGVAPTEEDCRLYVAVSDNGAFTMEDVILTLKGAELKLTDKAFEFNVEKTGAVQIAFFFENPAEHWDYAFNLEAYNLSLTAVPQEYTLSLTATPAEGGTLTGAGKHLEGSDVTITATPNEDYDFVAWMNGTTQLATTATYTFKMPASDAAYTAVFKAKPTVEPEEYELTLTASPANGGTISGAGSYLTGEDVTISAEANKGFKFVAWLNETDTLSKEATYTFKMPAEDLSLTARFVIETANEDVVKANFNVGSKNGEVYIRNLGGLMVKTVEIYTLTGNRLHRFTPNGREDLTLQVNAGQALLFVRIDTENGAAVYKVYLH